MRAVWHLKVTAREQNRCPPPAAQNPDSREAAVCKSLLADVIALLNENTKPKKEMHAWRSSKEVINKYLHANRL